MTSLANALAEYIALRRSLGFKLRQTARDLPRFVQFLEGRGATAITTELTLQWAQQDPAASSVTHADRLAMVRRFASWRSAADPRTEIPPAWLLPRRYQRPAPYIYSCEEIARIVSAAVDLPSPTGLRGLTYSTVFGLLAVTGMRIGEVVALDRDDVDLQAGILNVREGKLGKHRFVPIHATTQEALADYVAKRNAILPRAKLPAFFLSERGRRVSAFSAGDNFVKVSRQIGLRPPAAGRRRGRGPRLHDLRHQFAVAVLINWYRAGADVDREIPKLATYLGHEGPEQVYWYLQAVPDLLELATLRFQRAASGGAP
ncbi:MAG: tyrosine-type recombinase/integrase [Acidobacteriota bacterium]